MLPGWVQRHLAAAGLSLVTGAAAIGLAVVGVGPLGQVAASVHGAGAALSRGVLSVVMPADPVEQEAEPAAQEPVRAREAAAEDRPVESQGESPEPESEPESEEPVTGAPVIGAERPDTDGLLGPAGGALDDGVVESGGDPVEASSGSSGQEPGVVERLFKPVQDLTAGALR